MILIYKIKPLVIRISGLLAIFLGSTMALASDLSIDPTRIEGPIRGAGFHHNLQKAPKPEIASELFSDPKKEQAAERAPQVPDSPREMPRDPNPTPPPETETADELLTEQKKKGSLESLDTVIDSLREGIRTFKKEKLQALFQENLGELSLDKQILAQSIFNDILAIAPMSQAGKEDADLASVLAVEKWFIDSLFTKYREKSLLGRGANGKVYVIEEDGKEYALKIALAENLREEVENIKALQNCAVIKFISYEEKGYIGFLKMEKGEKSLEDLIENHEHIPDETLVAAIEAMVALRKALIDKKIEYMDIKPGNLMLMADGQVKAIDIGRGGTNGYDGSFGQRMAKTLLEVKLGATLLPRYGGYSPSKEYLRYSCRALFKEITNQCGAAINTSEDLLQCVGRKPLENLLTKNRPSFRDEIWAPNLSEAQLLEELLYYVVARDSNTMLRDLDRQTKIFAEALADTNFFPDYSVLKQELRDLYDME